jgi:hypothetical protein
MAVTELPTVVIQEGSAWGLTYAYTDKDGAPETPTVATFEIHDEASGVLMDSGSLTLASTVDITLTTSANTLNDSAKTQETRVLTVTNTYASSEDKQYITYRWVIKRTKFI